MSKYTLTAARKLARRARAHGYSHSRDNEIWVRCPECHQAVRTLYSPYEGTVNAQLDAAVINHLREDCGQDEDIAGGGAES